MKPVKIQIMHDTNFGNGKILAELLGKKFEEDHQIKINHINDTSPKTVSEGKPDVLILGGAIRQFQGAPASKKWLKELDEELSISNHKILYGTAFLTHSLPTKIIRLWKKRYYAKFNQVTMIEKVYPKLLTAQVKGQKGPFKDGVLDNASQFAQNFIEWIKSQ